MISSFYKFNFYFYTLLNTYFIHKSLYTSLGTFVIFHGELNQMLDMEQEKKKSNLSAGGATEIKPTISGFIINCMPTHEPKENPVMKVLGLHVWIASSLKQHASVFTFSSFIYTLSSYTSKVKTKLKKLYFNHDTSHKILYCSCYHLD